MSSAAIPPPQLLPAGMNPHQVKIHVANNGPIAPIPRDEWKFYKHVLIFTTMILIVVTVVFVLAWFAFGPSNTPSILFYNYLPLPASSSHLIVDKLLEDKIEITCNGTCNAKKPRFILTFRGFALTDQEVFGPLPPNPLRIQAIHDLNAKYHNLIDTLTKLETPNSTPSQIERIDPKIMNLWLWYRTKH